MKKAYIILDNGLEIEVIIKATKRSYGRDRYVVSPVAGNGEATIENIIIK